jgi:beta-galactosidase
MDGNCPPVSVLCDILKPTTAEVLARYTGDYYTGKPAITLNRFGAGRALYIGAVGTAQLYDPLAKWLLETTGLPGPLVIPPGVEVAERTNSDHSLRFLLNYNDSTQTIHLESPCLNLLNGTQLMGDVQLDPFDVLILTSTSTRE